MKPITLLSAATLASWLCTTGSLHAQLTINYDFAPGTLVPDEGQMSQVKTLGGLSGLTSFSNVTTRLTLTTGNVSDPMYLGDLYSSLTFGNSSESQRIAVLLNRPGRDDSDEFGSSLSSLNVILDDSAAGTNVWAATTATGIYNSDGRLGSNPAGTAEEFVAGSKSLAALNGSQLGSNQVSLVVADFSGGASATLSAWGVSVTGVAATGGTFTPGANAWISDTGSGATNSIGATLNTTDSSSGGLVLDIDGTTTFTAGVTGSGGLYKTGTGIVTLFEGSTSNYSGLTTVDSGVLIIDGSITGDVTVDADGILGGIGTIGGNLTVTEGGTHAAGNSPGLQTIEGNVTYGSGSIFAWELGSETTSGPGTNFDAVSVGGDLTVSGAIFKVIVTGLDLNSTFWSTTKTWDVFDTAGTATGTFSSFELYDSAAPGSPINYSSYGSFTFNSGTGGVVWSAVPEPSSALAGVLIAAGLLWRRRSLR